LSVIVRLQSELNEVGSDKPGKDENAITRDYEWSLGWSLQKEKMVDTNYIESLS
jgi:hypothetical protein